MTGMQTAKLKAEANGRKAKVLFRCIKESQGSGYDWQSVRRLGEWRG